MLYDAILLFAVLLLATAPLLLLTGGHAIGRGNPLYTAYLLVIGYGYFSWQWVHGGRTLGMKAWQVRLVGANRGPVGWKMASVRYLHSLILLLPFGLGLWWSLIDRERRTLYDRCSGTMLLHDGADAAG